MASPRVQKFFAFIVVVASLAKPCLGDARTLRDLEFASVDGQRLALDLYLPKATLAPLVVWIHGGGWHSGSKSPCAVAFLQDEGYAVASISYRLTHHATFPAQIHDCKAAIRWLRAHAKEFGYSPHRIAVAGESAGGHLAALVGTSGSVEALEGQVGGHTELSSSVDAVVDYFGATDFILRSRTQPQRANVEGSVVYRLLGGGANTKVAAAKLASAAYHVTPDDPPFLVFHGDRDQVVLLDQSERIAEVYRAAGLSMELEILHGSGHGGAEFYSGPARSRLLQFLQKQLRPNDAP